MTGLALRRFGAHAVLAEVGDLANVMRLHAALVGASAAGILELVPAARTVLVRFDPIATSSGAVQAWITDAAGAAHHAEAPAQQIEIPIVYDGEDLREVAALLGTTADALIARHLATPWRAAFTGFAPGFAYLVSDEWRIDAPRRASPRTRVPAGAVGLAGEFTGAYPRATPGGWQLIGTTTAPLFDLTAERPALITPGAAVRFVHERAVSRAGPGAASPPQSGQPQTPPQTSRPYATPPAIVTSERAAPDTPPAISIRATGLGATVQDLGRPARAAEGIARSGAADADALRLANRLLGNAEGAAGIELTLGGFIAVAHVDVWVVVVGAADTITIADAAVSPFTGTRWPAGTELRIAPFVQGLRAYLAVRGGIDVAFAVGSRSTDTLAELGPAPLAAGDVIRLADDAVAPVPALDIHPWSMPKPFDIELAVTLGPRDDWFTPAACTLLFDASWRVSPLADRVGVRLDGPPLERAIIGELPSEGMLPGAIQVPPSGQPVILGVDGPVTGGYPVIAALTERSLARLAQARPGTGIRFRRARPGD